MVAKGPVTASEVTAAGVPRSYLGRLVASGQIEHVSRGLYRAASNAASSELATLADVAKRVPHGTVCLLSALQLHGLTTELPSAVWLMIDRKARAPSIKSPRVELVRASGNARHHGVEERTIDGVSVRVTTPAKTVADCFRYRGHVGMEVALAALKDYRRKHRAGMDALVAAAKADRTWPFMRPYVEAVA
ncbi:MAG: type IV toxin-antitoxin system AbiEi family antitoxin domain-containing protein [Myxococcota bacterium]